MLNRTLAPGLLGAKVRLSVVQAILLLKPLCLPCAS